MKTEMNDVLLSGRTVSQLEAPFSILRSIDFFKVGDKESLSWALASPTS